MRTCMVFAGDILTDLSGAITGSLGLNPSANLNVSRDYPSVGMQRTHRVHAYLSADRGYI